MHPVAYIHHDGGAALGLGAFFICCALVLLPIIVLGTICWCRIFSRAGYPGVLGLLCLMPGLGEIVMLLILAFGKWPVLRDMDHLKQFHSPPRQG
jgi:hypothetical protein